MAEARKTSSKKPSSARRTAGRKRSTTKKNGDIPITNRSEKPLKGIGKKASAERQRGVLLDCMASLQRVSDACHPLSVWGILGLLVTGAVVGILTFIGVLYLIKATAPSPIPLCIQPPDRLRHHNAARQQYIARRF